MERGKKRGRSENRDGVTSFGLLLDMLVGNGLRVVAVSGGAVIMRGLLTVLVAGVAWWRVF